MLFDCTDKPVQLASNMILNRALIEIINQLKPDGLSDDLAEKLEEMVFTQIRNADAYCSIFLYADHS